MGGDAMILCNDLETFLNVIHGLVERGLTFTSNANDLRITLTGGF